MAGASAEHFQPISEHTPVWQEAVVKVSDAEKGESTREQVVARFAESTNCPLVRDAEALRSLQRLEGIRTLTKLSGK
jgi:hypothetical protein